MKDFTIGTSPVLRGQIEQVADSGAALLLCHGLPYEARRAPDDPGYTGWITEVAQRGYTAATFDFRGCYDSEGDLDFPGWTADVVAASKALAELTGTKVIVAASSLGGAATLAAAPQLDHVSAICTLAAPADLADLVAGDPLGLIERVSNAGLIRTPGFPSDPMAWASGFTDAPILAGAAAWSKPLLVLQGADDDVVVPSNADRIAAAASGTVVKSILPGVGHRVRHDETAKEQLMSWVAAVVRNDYAR